MVFPPLVWFYPYIDIPKHCAHTHCVCVSFNHHPLFQKNRLTDSGNPISDVHVEGKLDRVAPLITDPQPTSSTPLSKN